MEKKLAAYFMAKSNLVSYVYYKMYKVNYLKKSLEDNKNMANDKSDNG